MSLLSDPYPGDHLQGTPMVQPIRRDSLGARSRAGSNKGLAQNRLTPLSIGGGPGQIESTSPTAIKGRNLNLFVGHAPSDLEPTSASAVLSNLPIRSAISPVKIPGGGAAYIGHLREKTNKGF